jgi:hypothetical protein
MDATTSASSNHFAALSTLVFLEDELQSQLELAKSRSSLGEGSGTFQPMSSPMSQVQICLFVCLRLSFFLVIQECVIGVLTFSNLVLTT